MKGECDQIELVARFNSLLCKYDKITEADEKIKNYLLSDESTKDKYLQTELKTAGYYQYKFLGLLIKKRVEKMIKEDNSSIST